MRHPKGNPVTKRGITVVKGYDPEFTSPWEIVGRGVSSDGVDAALSVRSAAIF